MDDKNFHQHLLQPTSKKRKLFGLLERPNFPPSVPQVSYKLFVCGRPGSGKTWARSRIIGHEVCSEFGRDEGVAGIEASVVFWPMKVGNKMVLFRLELWEAGEWSVRRYDHILPACREGVNGVVLCFSLYDKIGWAELPKLLATSAHGMEKATVIPLATRIGSDPDSNWEIPPSELHELEKRCGVTVLHLPAPLTCNQVTDTLKTASGGLTEEMAAIAPTLNAICGQLWQRDQELLRH